MTDEELTELTARVDALTDISDTHRTVLRGAVEARYINERRIRDMASAPAWWGAAIEGMG